MVWTCAHTLCNNDGPSLGWIMGGGEHIYISVPGTLKPTISLCLAFNWMMNHIFALGNTWKAPCTSILNWSFGVPGVYVSIFIWSQPCKLEWPSQELCTEANPCKTKDALSLSENKSRLGFKLRCTSTCINKNSLSQQPWPLKKWLLVISSS